MAPRLCSSCEITTAIAATWTVRHQVHLDGPRGRKGWFGDIHVCNQQPRLQRVTKCFRATRTVVATWRVDGQPVEGGLFCACQRLNAPPSISVEEYKALARAPVEFLDCRKSPDLQFLLTLQDKGLIEFRAGKCRRTGARAISPTGDLI